MATLHYNSIEDTISQSFTADGVDDKGGPLDSCCKVVRTHRNDNIYCDRQAGHMGPHVAFVIDYDEVGPEIFRWFCGQKMLSARQLAKLRLGLK